MHEASHNQILGEHRDRSRHLSADQKVWLPREHARTQLLRTGVQWRHRSTRKPVTVLRIVGLRVIYKTRVSDRWPRGEAEASRAAFLNSFVPVSEKWLKSK